MNPNPNPEPVSEGKPAVTEVERPEEAEAEFDARYQGPFDGIELIRWAENYGHPEEWAKKAQAAHARAEKAEEGCAALQQERDHLIAEIQKVRDWCEEQATYQHDVGDADDLHAGSVAAYAAEDAYRAVLDRLDQVGQ